ncbi:MAG: acyltransferase family protein [Alphaproteobacteria bacterium]|nr:acyltransferase family protein [Alphaproteobacteria bacterium]
MTKISFFQPTKKHYLSFFKWIFFLLIVIYHSLFLFTKPAFLSQLAYTVYDYIPFLVDCFFVISGFLLARSFYIFKPSIATYISKRLLDFVPTLLLFWLIFALIGKLGWVQANLTRGFTDVLGLPIFGVLLVNNQLNYTWFLYTLFWCNVFFLLLLSLKKFAPFLIIPILISTGFILSSYWIEGNVISPTPYDNLPISFGLFRGIFASSIGILITYLVRFTPSFIQKSPFLFYVLGLLEATLIILALLMASQLTAKEIYINGLSLFGLLLFSLSFENSPLFKVLNQKIFSYGSSFLLGGYIFSAISIAFMAQILVKYPAFTSYGNSVYIAVILISLSFGALCQLITQQLKKKL